MRFVWFPVKACCRCECVPPKCGAFRLPQAMSFVDIAPRSGTYRAAIFSCHRMAANRLIIACDAAQPQPMAGSRRAHVLRGGVGSRLGFWMHL